MTRTRQLGTTGLTVGELTIGGSALGRPDLAEDRAQATLDRALACPVTVLDTGNNYGLSEERVGRALARGGGLPAGHLVVTKVDPLAGSTDFSGRRVRESVRESLDRLGLDHLPLVHLHDPERITLDEVLAPDGPARALLELRESGVIGHVGVAGGPVALLEELVRTGMFEAVVTHNRYSLLDRSAESLLDLCAERGIGVFNAAPYGGGLLAGSERARASYAYRPVSDAQAAAARAMGERCAAHGVALGAAALQFSTRDPRVASTIVGVTRPEHVDDALAHAAAAVPEGLWAELESLVPPRSEWLGPHGPRPRGRTS
jgi:D-threo-aldose 1-dehydrogenase